MGFYYSRTIAVSLAQYSIRLYTTHTVFMVKNTNVLEIAEKNNKYKPIIKILIGY